MKILRIIYDWPPPWNGLAPNPYEITLSQTKMGHTVDIFCGRWPKAGDPVSMKGVKLHSFLREPIPGSISFTTSLYMFVYYLFWRNKNSVDVIHAHGHFALWIYLYRKVLKKLDSTNDEFDVPIVAHFHNTVVGREEALKKKGVALKFVSQYIAWPFEKLANTLAVEVASALIFVSEDTKNEAIKYYKAIPEKCFVVENGVNIDSFTPIKREEKEKTRKDLGLDMLDKVILYHGQLVERKNAHLAVEALALLPQEYKLILMGPGNEDYIDRIEKIILEKKLSKRVIKIGYTPYLEVPIAFQAADLFILPSSWEGLPKVVMQSLACGVPALASGFKLNTELTGLFYLENLEPATIAKQIKSVLSNPIYVDVSLVRSKFSWDYKASQIESIYKQIIK